LLFLLRKYYPLQPAAQRRARVMALLQEGRRGASFSAQDLEAKVWSGGLPCGLPVDRDSLLPPFAPHAGADSGHRPDWRSRKEGGKQFVTRQASLITHHSPLIQLLDEISVEALARARRQTGAGLACLVLRRLAVQA